MSERVHWNAIAPELIVQVRAGGSTGGPDEPDEVALPDMLSGSDHQPRQVRVARLQPIAMIKNDEKPIAAGPVSAQDPPVIRRRNWRTRGCAKIDPGMSTHSALRGQPHRSEVACDHGTCGPNWTGRRTCARTSAEGLRRR